MEKDFYAMLSRMKYIERWALMRNAEKENISEHSLDVAILTHALAIISRERFQNDVNIEKAVLIALYHDCTEIITGDMPTPMKYHNKTIEDAYKALEDQAANHLLQLLPPEMRKYYEELFFPNPDEAHLWKLKKAADKLSALIKCIKEEQFGNSEFTSAKYTLEQSLKNMKLPEVDLFMEEYLPAYYKTLDQLQNHCDDEGEGT